MYIFTVPFKTISQLKDNALEDKFQALSSGIISLRIERSNNEIFPKPQLKVLSISQSDSKS